MRSCSHCGATVESAFRFCPWCSSPQRLKVVEFFRPHPLIHRDRGKALRVSRYFSSLEETRHVRISVWNDSGEAQAAISLEEVEAQRLGTFLAAPRTAARSLGSVLAQVRERIRTRA